MVQGLLKKTSNCFVTFKLDGTFLYEKFNYNLAFNN